MKNKGILTFSSTRINQFVNQNVPFLKEIRARKIKTAITNFTANCAKYWQLEELELGSTVRADRESYNTNAIPSMAT